MKTIKTQELELKPMTLVEMEGLLIHVLHYAHKNQSEFLETPPLKDTYYNAADIHHLIQELYQGNLKLMSRE